MYCPNCGKGNTQQQRFCRSCGLGLQTISQALVHELSATRPDGSPVEMVKHEQRGWHNPLVYGLLLLILGMVIVIFGKKIAAEQLIADLGMLIGLLGIGLLGFRGVGLILFPPEPTPRSETLLEGEPTNELPRALEPGAPHSVTEHTTRQFETVHSKRKAE